ncbi:MAG: hypothetical protein IKK95_07270 [Lachnospiraceae bacterium]|nr:hypothetical protein [Lachnospiraceae bacterium]
MEKKKIQRILSEKKPRLIGIGGIGHSVGCTHFSIMMANYLAGYRRRNTVLLEWNRSGDFERLEKVCTGINREEKRFCVLDVQYRKDAGIKELTEVLGNNVDEILIDFGAVNEELPPELLRCEKQFLVGSFSEWQEMCFREFVRENENGNRSWKYLAAFGSEETRREFRRRPRISVGRIPFSADAFSVTTESCSFFQQLIDG